MLEEWDITATNLNRARRRRYEVAVLSVGAIEAHGLHLPFGQDFLEVDHIARRACAAAWERRQSVLYLPPLPYGVDANLMAFPYTVHVNTRVLEDMLREMIGSLARHGLRKFVLINGHGGNDFGPMIRQVQYDLGVHVFNVNWWQVGLDQYRRFFSIADDHAGEMETSVALATHPELVEMENAADGRTRPFALEALARGWATTSRDFGKFTAYCNSANPMQASAEKGRQYLELTIRRIADFLVELAKAPIDKHFPFAARWEKTAHGRITKKSPQPVRVPSGRHRERRGKTKKSGR